MEIGDRRPGGNFLNKVFSVREISRIHAKKMVIVKVTGVMFRGQLLKKSVPVAG